MGEQRRAGDRSQSNSVQSGTNEHQHQHNIRSPRSTNASKRDPKTIPSSRKRGLSKHRIKQMRKEYGLAIDIALNPGKYPATKKEPTTIQFNPAGGYRKPFDRKNYPRFREHRVHNMMEQPRKLTHCQEEHD